MDNKTIGFIGGGAMAEAFVSGLLQSEFCKAEKISVSDVNSERLENLRNKYKVNVYTDNGKVAGQSDVVVLAVKPQILPDIVEEIAPHIKEGAIVISIAAGVRISTIATVLKAKIVRAMPNMCAKVRESVTAICHNPSIEEEDMEYVERMFTSVGKTVRVSEKHMDAVTGISGSGPAYIFLIMEALIQAGVENGLTLEQSRILVEQTVKGAAEMALASESPPEELRKSIMSPQGTTVAALHVMEQKGIRGALLDAVSAAVKRSKELG